MLKSTVCVLDFVDFVPSSTLNLERQVFMVAPAHGGMLAVCRQYGLRLVADDLKTYGFGIVATDGRELGYVTVWGNQGWLDELMADLTELAANPQKYGLSTR